MAGLSHPGPRFYFVDGKVQVELHLGLEDVEFIGMEMPSGDGWTRDFNTEVWSEMLRLQRNYDDEVAGRITIIMVPRDG